MLWKIVVLVKYTYTSKKYICWSNTSYILCTYLLDQAWSAITDLYIKQNISLVLNLPPLSVNNVESAVMGIKPKRWANTSSWTRDVLLKISMWSIAIVGTCGDKAELVVVVVVVVRVVLEERVVLVLKNVLLKMSMWSIAIVGTCGGGACGWIGGGGGGVGGEGGSRGKSSAVEFIYVVYWYYRYMA